MKGDVQGANLRNFFPGLTICTETGNKLGWKPSAALLVSKYMLTYSPKVQCPVLNNSLFGRKLNQSNPVHRFTTNFYNVILTPKYHLAFPRSRSPKGIPTKILSPFLVLPSPTVSTLFSLL